MFELTKKLAPPIILGLIWLLFSNASSHAQPFGAGLFDANVPFGSETSLTIATSGNITIPLTPSDSGTLATGSGTITVISTDVVGYKLYIRSLSSTNLANGSATIPASTNGSPAGLADDTWGYNTDGSSNYVGLTLSNVLIRTGTGPFTSGDVTTTQYGVKVDNAKPAGNYSSTIIYTAVPQTN